MKKLLTIALILCTVTGFAQMRGGAQYDPGAARKNLSNVDSAATPSMTSITLSDKVKAAWADILGDIYASGTVRVGAGTAAAPAYSFGSDPDTGIYSPGANILGFGVGGNRKAAIDATGLGINIDAPVTSFHVHKANNTLNGIQITNSGTGATITDGLFLGLDDQLSYLYMYENRPLIIAASASEVMRFTGGNVLIGTSTNDGANKLQINGFTKLGEAATGIKMAIATGTTAATEGGSTYVSLTINGVTIDAAKIVGTTARVFFSSNGSLSENCSSTGAEFYITTITDSGIIITNHPTNSENILERPVVIMIWYKE